MKQEKKHFPGGHNNLGVLLAIIGKYSEAQDEFKQALEQSKGKMPHALHNLKLCQALINSSSPSLMASLQTSSRLSVRGSQESWQLAD